MNDLTPEAYINYRINLAQETFEAAQVLVENEKWNSAVNRLYYACFYMVTALLVSKGIKTKTHTGVKIKFLQEFVKTGIIEVRLGKLYTDLLDWRQRGDFFDFTGEEVTKMMKPVETLIDEVNDLIKREYL